ARLPPKVGVAVPMPEVSVASATVTSPSCSFGDALGGVWMLDASVAAVALHVIAPVVKPSKVMVNVPAVGVPPMVSVWTSFVPADGTPAFRIGFALAGSPASCAHADGMNRASVRRRVSAFITRECARVVGKKQGQA